MADELRLNAVFEYADDVGQEEAMSIEDLLVTLSTKSFVKVRQLIPTAETDVFVGDLTSLGYALFVNRDENNFIELKTNTGGSGKVFAKLYPGWFAVLPLGPDSQQPTATADSAACNLDIFICST